ncbi:MAG: cyclopropane fatty acyl phospholipid synthase [Desulfobacterales bacterium]
MLDTGHLQSGGSKSKISKSREIVEGALNHAGITIGGDNPWDIQVNNEEVFDRIVRDGELGVGESYMEGWWDCQALDQFFDKVFRAKLQQYFKDNWKAALHLLKAKLLNLQKNQRAYKVGKQHYDVGNDLYRDMLDSRMAYTCGYWSGGAADLDEAQEAKLDLVCRKIGLEPGMKVLDLGCGWGCFAKYAAEKYGAEVTGLTVSQEQVDLGNQICQGLPVNIYLDDYRNATGTYDRVVSIGIMEHVGYKNYRTYMEVANRCMKDDGIALIHTIGGNVSATSANPWTTTYIFPNSMLPSISQLGAAMEGIFVMEDWHNFGPDYDKTLMAWDENFEKSWPKYRESYGERFYRMWKFYLMSSAGAFRSRSIQLWQIVMTKPGREQPDCRLS